MSRKELFPVAIAGAACVVCCLPLIVVAAAAIAGFAAAFTVPLIGVALIAVALGLYVIRRRQLARSCGCDSPNTCTHSPEETP